MKRIFSLILITALLLSCTALAGNMEGNGYNTPQDAATAYVEALNKGDVQEAVSTFAIETFVDNVDTKAYIQRLQSMMITNVYTTIPVNGKLSRGILIEQRRNAISDYIYYMYLLYSTAGTDFSDVGYGQMYSTNKDDTVIDSYLGVMQASPVEAAVGKINITGAYLPTDAEVAAYVPDVYHTEKAQENRDRQLACYGGDELAEVAVLFDLNGTPYVQFMQCVRYGEKWYNVSQSTTIGAMFGLSNNCGGLLPIADLM